MKNFLIEYRLRLTTDREVNHHFFSLRCLPKTEARQQAQHTRIRVNADYFSYSEDCFGNRFIYGYKDAPGRVLDLYMRSEVRVDYLQYDMSDRLKSVFKMQTPQTEIGENLADFAAYCAQETQALQNDYERCVLVSDLVHAEMEYKKGVTDIKTTADAAFGLKCGVCQDYAQIMAGVLRYMGIPARYVAGAMEGEELTHAWVEAWAGGRWYGFDPTNRLLVSDRYIVFSRGRDYRDCLVNKGIFYSPVLTKQAQEIKISVEEVHLQPQI